jgi:hypothetical protein
MNALIFNNNKPENPIDGDIYFDQDDQSIHAYSNGIWNRMNNNRYVIKIPCLTDEENEKLTEIKYNTTYVGCNTTASIFYPDQQEQMAEEELLKQVGKYIDKYREEYNDKVVFALEEWLLNRI